MFSLCSSELIEPATTIDEKGEEKAIFKCVFNYFLIKMMRYGTSFVTKNFNQNLKCDFHCVEFLKIYEIREFWSFYQTEFLCSLDRRK